MINIGDLEIAGVYIGDVELSVYAGDELIYPLNFGTLTGISLDNLTWVTDVPASGGTATSANCSFIVTAHFDSGKTKKVTNSATISGSLVVPSTSAETREMVGTLTLTASYSGFTDSDSVDVYQESSNIDYSQQYLTIEITSAGYLKWFSTTASSTYYKTIQYSKDNGTTWTSVTSTNANNGTTINVSVGDIILFKSTNQQLSSRWDRTTGFRNSTAGFKVYGNVMSMIYGDNYIGQTTLPLDNNFAGLFRNCTGLTSAENLVLPATILRSGCYRNMFQDCKSLTSIPKLTATSLATYCYTSMFTNCTSLTQAPELPATTLQQYCYQQMFINCSNLSYIKCLATNISAAGCTDSWVSNVAASGTFVKAAGVSWSSGNSGIPSNWTVENV